MTRYRKKPVVIEAVRWLGTNRDEVAQFLLVPVDDMTFGPNCDVFIHTLEGTMRADFGDWIIKGVQGECYPCKPDIFDATYEAVD
jgi:hypothetical protein